MAIVAASLRTANYTVCETWGGLLGFGPPPYPLAWDDWGLAKRSNLGHGVGVMCRTPPSYIHDYRCFGVFGSGVCVLCGCVLGFLRVLRPLLP